MSDDARQFAWISFAAAMLKPGVSHELAAQAADRMLALFDQRFTTPCLHCAGSGKTASGETLCDYCNGSGRQSR